MSASQTPPEPQTGTQAGPAAAATGTDPSMEDILASIRRILSEDEAPAGSGGEPAPPVADTAPRARSDDVLVLDPSMIVPEPAPEPMPAIAPQPVAIPEPAAAQPTVEMAMSGSSLVAPEAAAAAASSVGSLIRTLAAERNLQVRTGGPTIEDIVREELRPLLKSWLDDNLAPMVERLVRTEIERLVGRAVP